MSHVVNVLVLVVAVVVCVVSWKLIAAGYRKYRRR